MMPLTWALKDVYPVGLHRQSGIHAQEIYEYLKYYAILGQICTLRLQQIRSYYIFPIYLAGRWALANGALCLSTAKHNGKSSTE
jgi:hypothetical protein